ncbi:MAG: cytidylate kinase [Rhodobacteraceae bacterium]|nr:MAG: cytidylate kinase [Paracoccaceae bacterium]
MSFIVAIDGPAAAGKGTISKAVAAHFGFAHLDTGLLYRGVGKKALAYSRTSYYPEVAEQLARELTADDLLAEGLRTPEVAQAASKIAVIPQVRSALVDFQKTFAKQSGGAVLDGRDIGTVICPDADVKLFITASAEIRAERRFKELTNSGQNVELSQVLQDVIARDARDASRDIAPMVVADDAVVINTTELSIEAAIKAAITVIEAQRSQG